MMLLSTRHKLCEFVHQLARSLDLEAPVYLTAQARTFCTSLTSASYAENAYTNPLTDLQSYLAIPLSEDSHSVFNPSRKEMEDAQKLFVPAVKHDIRFLKSVVSLQHLPIHEIPEVAFLGRSNVGKSSLIQALFRDAADVMVRISKRPGHTRTMNFFKVGQALSLVDMPGYGFNMPDHFVQSVEAYLASRKKLSRCFLLIDAGSGICNADQTGIEMMEEFKIPYAVSSYMSESDWVTNSFLVIHRILNIGTMEIFQLILKMTFVLIDGKIGFTRTDELYLQRFRELNTMLAIVLTKVDKVNRHQLLKNLFSVMKVKDSNTHCCFSQPFIVSSVTGVGMAYLQAFIGYVTGNLHIKGL